MYARSYKDGDIGALPPHYDGVAFGEESPQAQRDTDTENVETLSTHTDGGILGTFFGGELLRGIRMPKIGTEELLLIAAAAFLFFSKEGDKECAILLLVLVFLA